MASLKLPFLGKFSTKRKDRGIGAKLEGQGGVCYRRAEFYRSTASLLRRNQSRSFAGCLLTWWENIIHQILSSEYRSLEAAQISGLSKGVPCTNRKYYSPWCITCVSSSWEKNLSSETLKLQIKVPLKELVFAFSKTGNKCRVVDGVKSIRYFYYFSLRALKYKPNVCSQR